MAARCSRAATTSEGYLILSSAIVEVRARQSCCSSLAHAFKLLAAALTIVMVSLAACGTSGSTKTDSVTGPPHALRSRPTRIYRVQLGRAAEPSLGALHGTGAAIIVVHGESTVCWRFAHLHGFADATIAEIRSGVRRQPGGSVAALSTGPRLHHQGCVRISTVLSKMIWTDPGHYSVNIATKEYPHGAVRAQL